MPWVRLDDLFPEHRKVRRLSDAAFRLHVEAKCWASRHLTDGHIPGSELEDVTDKRRPERYAEQLVARGLWHLPGHDCASIYCYPIGDGWLIHDFLDYQPSAEQVRAEREAAKQRQRKAREVARERRAQEAAGQDVTPTSRRDTGVSHGDVTVPPSRPDPARPVPSPEPPQVGSGSTSSVPPARPLPLQLEELRQRLEEAKLLVEWTLTDDEVAAVVGALDRVGPAALVEYAKRRHRADSPAFSVRAWLTGWAGLHPRRLESVPDLVVPCDCGNGYPNRRHCPTCRAHDMRSTA